MDVSATRRVRQDGLGHGPAHRKPLGPDLLPALADDQDQHARARRKRDVDRVCARWVPQHRGLVQLCAGQREPGLALVRRNRGPSRQPAGGAEQLDLRIPARRVPGHTVQHDQADPIPQAAQRSLSRQGPRRARSTRTTQPTLRRAVSRRQRTGGSGGELRAGCQDAAFGAESDRPAIRDSRDPGAVRSRRHAEHHQGPVRPQLHPGPTPRRAGRAVCPALQRRLRLRRTPELGRTQQAQAPVRSPLGNSRSTGRRPADRPGPTRDARGHRAGLLHRVRSATDVSARDAGPRPQPARLHLLAGRSRGQGTVQLRGNRRIQLRRF